MKNILYKGQKYVLAEENLKAGTKLKVKEEFLLTILEGSEARGLEVKEGNLLEIVGMHSLSWYEVKLLSKVGFAHDPGLSGQKFKPSPVPNISKLKLGLWKEDLDRVEVVNATAKVATAITEEEKTDALQGWFEFLDALHGTVRNRDINKALEKIEDILDFFTSSISKLETKAKELGFEPKLIQYKDIFTGMQQQCNNFAVEMHKLKEKSILIESTDAEEAYRKSIHEEIYK